MCEYKLLDHGPAAAGAWNRVGLEAMPDRVCPCFLSYRFELFNDTVCVKSAVARGSEPDRGGPFFAADSHTYKEKDKGPM
jgi:hypothetical protein